MPLRLKLWKKSHQYNVSDHWLPDLDQRRATHPFAQPLHSVPQYPLVVNEFQSEIPVAGNPPSGMMGIGDTSNNNNSHKRIVYNSKQEHQEEGSDPIYVNAHACAMASSAAISSCSSHYPAGDDVSLNRLSQIPTSSDDRCWPMDSVESDRISLDERRKLLPLYTDPPDYDEYMRKKYNQGSPV